MFDTGRGPGAREIKAEAALRALREPVPRPAMKGSFPERRKQEQRPARSSCTLGSEGKPAELKPAGGFYLCVFVPGRSDGKESACSAGDPGLIPGSGRSPGGQHGNPLQDSCLENLHGQRSLADSSLWGHKESNMTERLTHTVQEGIYWILGW